MTIEQWLEDGKSDAYRRKLPELADILDGLAQSTAVLRAADWNDDAAGEAPYAASGDVAFELKFANVPASGAGESRESCTTDTEQPTIVTLSEKLARGEITSERLTEDALAVISERNPRLNAFITVTGEVALAAAREADKDLANMLQRAAAAKSTGATAKP